MASHSQVWVVVPTYNEAPVVGDVLRGLLAVFPQVVAVDDGSTDGSGDAIRQAGARLVTHPINMGAGAALQTGIDYALRDPNMRTVVTFDADGQHRVEDAVGMVEYLSSRDLDVVIGSRFLGSEAVNMPASKRRLLKVATVFEKLTSGVKLTDAHQGLRAFNRGFAQKLQMRTPDMGWASEFLSRIQETEARFEEYPVSVEYSEYSRAKGQRSINSVNIGIDVLINRLLRGHR